MLDPEIADLCKCHIERDYQTLSDLPEELADTIANIYYRFYRENIRRVRSPNTLPSSIREGKNIFVDLKESIKTDSGDLAFVEGGPMLIEGIRHLCEIQDKSFAVAVAIIIDQWKYGIENSHKKTGIRCMVERFFRRRHVKEIAGLAAALGLRN